MVGVFAMLAAALPARAEEDPLEHFNKMMFDFNARYYSSTAGDVTKTISEYVPVEVRQSIGNFFANLGEPIVVLSSLASGEYDNAKLAARRFAVNSIYGIGGLYDKASQFGIRSAPKDLGQVLCAYGVPDGPYLVLPFYGPATVTDFVGTMMPVMAGYVAFGEAFWAYRASSQVATIIEDQPETETGEHGAAEHGNDYAALKARYYRGRTQVCRAVGKAPTQTASLAPADSPVARTELVVENASVNIGDVTR